MKSAVKTVSIVMIIMILSRILSLVSSQVYITHFGIGLHTDIYSYAIQLPNTIFTSFGTAITTVFIPIFAGYIAKNQKRKADEFSNNIIGISLIFTVCLSMVGFLISPLLVMFTRFRVEGYEFSVTTLRIMFPVVIFYALNYAFQGILQSKGKYNMPALVSIPSSVVVIGYVFLLGDKYGIMGLTVATLIGLSLQALILIPPIMATDYKFKLSFNFKNIDIRKAIKLMPPVLIGTSAYQLNMLFNISMAANYKDGATIITLVQNLILYAVLAFIYSITAVFFPKFSMLYSKGDMDGFKECLIKVIKTVIYFVVPIAAGFIVLSYELLDFIYGYAKVTEANIYTASIIMILYALGVTGNAVKEILDRAFYSLKDTKKPAINGFVIMIINITLSLSLIKFIGLFAIPLSNSIAILVGAYLIYWMIRKRVGNFPGEKLSVYSLKIVFSSGIMLIVVLCIKFLLAEYSTGILFIDKGLKLLVPSGVGGIVYLIVTYLFRLDRAQDILDKVIIRTKAQKVGDVG